MKRILFAVILSLFSISIHAQVTTQNARRLSSGTAVPSGACTVGPPYTQVYIRTTDQSIYECTGASTWTKVVSGGTPVSGSGTSGQVAFWNGTSSIAGDSDMTFATDTLTVTKLGVTGAQTNSSTITQTSASATAFESGPNGGTNPVLRLVNNTASQADGLSITGNASGNGTIITAISPGADSSIFLVPKGSNGRLDVSSHVNIANGFNLTWGGNYAAGIPTIIGSSGAGAQIQFRPTGTTDAEVARFVASGLKIGGTVNRGTTEGSKHLDVFDGTAPVGTLASGWTLYSASGVSTIMQADGTGGRVDVFEQNPAQSATKTGNFTVFSQTPVAAAGTYRVDGVITTTSSTNTGTVQFTLDYKDSQGTVHTADIIPLVDAAGAIAATKSGASKEFWAVSKQFTIDATATAIALKVVITGSVSYTVTGSLERIR